MPDSKGKKLADALYGQPEEKAAFGVFPQMKPRRSRQDPEAAKDVPRQLLRGWAAGTLGLPGDIEGLIRMLPGLDETPRLPTSEFYLDYLPGKAEGESGKTAAAAGTLFGGLGSTKVARGALEAGKGAAKLAERAAAMPSPSGLAAQRGVVKLPGGNWLPGNLESGLRPLLKAENLDNPDQAKALNKWLNTKLTKYIRNEMATPQDPLRIQADEFVAKKAEMLAKKDAQIAKAQSDLERAQAERGVAPEVLTRSQARLRELRQERAYIDAQQGLHFEPPGTAVRAYTNRALAEMPKEPTSTSAYGMAWEDVSDASVLPGTYRGHTPFDKTTAEAFGEFAGKNPDMPAYKFDEISGRNLGFDHLIDELRNALNPNSGLPEKLRLDVKDIETLTVPRAAKLVDEINAWRSVQKAEADAARAGNAATVEYRAYDTVPGSAAPNERGLRWVELKMPEPDPNHQLSGSALEAYNKMSPEGQAAVRADLTQSSSKAEAQKILEDALKYEGEIMKHCVGAYCPSVASGRSRIFSLRDAKGEPHVTIEVQPAAEHRGFGRGGQRPPEEDYYRLQEEWLEGNRNGTIDPNLTFAEWWRSTQGLPEDKRPPQIVQIKGKQNLAPKEEYLPYVQDFVRGGQWSQIGDLKNTGLRRIEAPEGVKYLTEDEYGDHILRELGVDPAEGMKRGGAVMAAATIDGGEFVRVAEKYGLGSDNATLNKIVRLVNQGMSLDKAAQSVASSGKVHISDNPDTMRLELAGGGAPKAIAQRLKTLREQLAEKAAAAEAIQARDRKLPLEQIPEGSLTPEAIEAEIKRMREEKGMAAGGAAKALKALAKGAKEEEKAAIKASEALGQMEGRPLLITQTDRSKVGGKWLGGPGFSGLQHTRPEYKAAEAAWGVAQPATAKTILGGYQKAKKEFGAEPVMTTMLGTPTQHQSNKMVFEELHRLFKKSAKDGNLDPELLDKINTRLRMAEDKQGKPIFPEDVNILAPDFRKVANTFDRRAVASNLMGGMTVGGKKGQIIDYDEVIRHTTDPALLEAPSGALGNRMFTLSGGIVDRPDLHPAFPSILQGEDLNVMFSPVARELVMRDFIERTMREKGRTPGYMDYTRGYPPTQLITEELLTDLQKKGFAEGGAVSGISGDDLIIEERPL